MAYADDAEHEELHEPTSFIAKYVWSQDHKVIAIQYSLIAIFVGLVALVLSAMMRMQIGFPESIDMDSTEYYQAMTMHGMIMVIYLLTALFLGGFGNYLIPLMVGARDMVFPFVNMLSVWFYLRFSFSASGKLFCPRGPHRSWVDAISAASHNRRYSRCGMGYYFDASLSHYFYCRCDYGGA